MPLPKVIQRELEVAFAKHVQPLWLRILKYVILAAIIYFLWDSGFLWIILVVLLGSALSLHLWVRYKTKGWTQSYGRWDYEKNKPKHDSGSF